jgi:hypothetical protein
LQKPSNVNPVLGPLSGSNYVVFDGFFVAEVDARAANSGGVIQLHGTTGSQYRRCVVDRDGAPAYASGANGNALYFEATIDCSVIDCMFLNRPVQLSNVHNDASIQIYNSANYLIQHCTFDNALDGIYPKENDRGAPYVQSGRILYNKFLNCIRSLEVQQGVTTEVAYNLMYLPSALNEQMFLIDGLSDPRVGTLDFNIHHNTIVVSGSNHAFSVENDADIGPSIFENNIIYAVAGHTGRFLRCTVASTEWSWSADWSLDDNCYFTAGTLTFLNSDGSTVTGIANWRTAVSDEASTITDDPRFVSLALHDYRLQAGSPASGKGCYVTGSEEIGVRANPSY